MNFAKWETLENMKEMVRLSEVDGKEKIKSSGLPIAYDSKHLYVDSRDGHTLVIGSTGSGKTQAITLPMLNLAWLASESIIVSDSSNELYDTTKDEFDKNGYKIIRLNLDEAIDTNRWNPFELVEKLYAENNYDTASEVLSNIGYYLLSTQDDKNSDPFWITSAISYFTGICLYLLENKKELNIDAIYDMNEIIKDSPDKFIKSLDKHSASYINLSSILLAPNDTRMSIISVFEVNFKAYVGKENLRKLLAKSDFNISKISSEKTAVFVKCGKSKVSANLLPLFIEEVYESKKDKNKLNIIIDEFYNANPVLDFTKLLSYSRGVGIRFTMMVRGFNDLKNTYGKEEAEMVRLGFSNIVYLLSQDIDTLEEMSRLCGKASKDTPLVSVEDLKTLKPFEAIVLTTRMMPFKTKLLPYYEIEKK